MAVQHISTNISLSVPLFAEESLYKLGGEWMLDPLLEDVYCSRNLPLLVVSQP